MGKGPENAEVPRRMDESRPQPRGNGPSGPEMDLANLGILSSPLLAPLSDLATEFSNFATRAGMPSCARESVSGGHGDAGFPRPYSDSTFTTGLCADKMGS